MTRSQHPPRRNTLSVLVQASLSSLFAVSLAHAATCTVNSNTDDPSDASAKVTSTDFTLWPSGGGPNPAIVTLRDCIVAANLMTGANGVPTSPGMIIDLSGIAGQTVTLADNLPLIFNNATISAGNSAPVQVDGGGAHRIFFVSGLPSVPGAGPPTPDGSQPTTVYLSTLILKNGKAAGGTAWRGGGGMGAGGALFVNKEATVALYNVSFANNAANGGLFAQTYANANGSGGSASSGGKVRGGGGLGGSGGGSPGFNGTGGGGIGANGATAGGSFGSTGIGQISNVQNFGAGFGGGAYGGGTSAVGGIGGGGGGGGNTVNNAGFGGGGGADQFYGGRGGFGGGGGSSYGIAGAGGFGGGGGRGGSSSFGAGGSGGFGGGGGGCTAGCTGNAGAGGVGGGAGQKGGGTFGGGAAGFGGAVFVRGGGTLDVAGYSPGGSINGDQVNIGIGQNNGAASGAGLFLMSGANTAFNIASNVTYTISDGIADDSNVSLPGGTYTAGCSLGNNDNGDPTNGGGPYTCGAGINKVGSGTLILDSTANTYAGSTAITSGTLGGNGTLAGPANLVSGAQIAPGNPANNGGAGILTLGSLTWNGGGAIAIQLGATNSITDSDLLVLNGPLTKSGTGSFAFHFGKGNGIPVAGTTYTLIQSSDASSFSASDFSFDFDATYQNLSGTFGIVGNAVQFTIDAVTSDVIFANGFE